MSFPCDAMDVPLKFVLLRGGEIVERRRVRLASPTMAAVQATVRQWAYGGFALRYTDDEGDDVTMEEDEEWAECVALWAMTFTASPLVLHVDLRGRRRRSCPAPLDDVVVAAAATPENPAAPAEEPVAVPEALAADDVDDEVPDNASGDVPEAVPDVLEAIPDAVVAVPDAAEVVVPDAQEAHTVDVQETPAAPASDVHEEAPAADNAPEVPSARVVPEAAVVPASAAPDVAFGRCAGCTYAVTSLTRTHCCRACAKRSGRHTRGCQRVSAVTGPQGLVIANVVPLEAAVPVETEASEVPRGRYAQERQTLWYMGFSDDARCRAALEACGGDLPEAVARLLE